MIHIFNIPMHDGTLPEIVDMVVTECGTKKGITPRCVSATGAHGLVETKTDPSFAKVLANFALNLPDGMPVVWLGRLKGARGMRRCYGPDFFRDFRGDFQIVFGRQPVAHALYGAGCVFDFRSYCVPPARSARWESD